MQIELLTNWRGRRAGTRIHIAEVDGARLVRRGMAVEVGTKVKRVKEAPRNKAVQAARKVKHGAE